MNQLRIASFVLAFVIIGYVRLLPLSLDGATRGAESAVRAAIAREVGDGSPPAAGQVEGWIRDHASEFAERVKSERASRRADFSFVAEDGRVYPYLGGFDSYVWLRSARNVLRHGDPCDSVVDGECRDDYTLAPVGVRSRYATSFHVRALAALHRGLSLFRPDLPLSVSGFSLSYLIGLLGVFPSYWLGNRFGGALGGFVCSVVAALNTTVLYRTFGADNDVWNFVLPLFQVWAIVEAMYAASLARRFLLVAVAAIVTGVHAATWAGWIFTSGVVLLGLGANALLSIARWLIHKSSKDARSGVWRSAAILVGYLVAASLATSLVGSELSPAAALGRVIRTVAGRAGVPELGMKIAPRPARPAPARPAPIDNDHAQRESGAAAVPADVSAPPARRLKWPSVFETVGELRDPSLGGIARSMGGPVLFFAAWLGMILLMLPRRDWQSWHFMLLIGGNLLYRYLLTQSGVDPFSLALLLLIPLTMGVGAYLADRSRPVEDQGAGFTIILWFLGGLVVAHQGNRFLLLLAPPMGVLFGVAVGRLYDWLDRQEWARPLPLRAIAIAALAATVWSPVQQARAMASSYIPQINDTWHGALERLRDETPPEAVINSWWDYGYFIKYFADRRVLADGGTLRTRVHHWTALALMSPSAEESFGILRMLNCGSAAYPEPEGALGAFGRLLASGVSQERAYAAVLALASMDEVEAARHLGAMGLSDPQVADVMMATHCRPAPAFLLVPSTLIYSVGWRTLGGVSLVDAVASAKRGAKRERAIQALTKRFGLSPEQAGEALRRADRRKDRGARRGFATAAWVPCEEGADAKWRCETGIRLPSGEVTRAVLVDPADLSKARIVVRDSAGDEVERSPDSIIVAGTEGLKTFQVDTASRVEPALLIDLEQRRVLLGSDQILRSTFTGLMFLDGRYHGRFREFDRRGGRQGQIVTWEIEW